MRVLLTSYAETTHFLSLVPLGWALRNAGHDVRVASQPSLTDVVADTGLTSVPVGRDHLLHEFLKLYFDPLGSGAGQDVGFFQLAHRWAEELTWQEMWKEYNDSVAYWLRSANNSMLMDLTEFCRWWKPDLVLWEPLTFAAPVAAKACGAAHARHLWGLDMLGLMRQIFLKELSARRARGEEASDPLERWLTTCAEKAGTTFDEELTRGQFTVDYVPDPLRLATLPGVDRVPLRYVPYNGRAVLPDWLRAAPGRRRVCLTLGGTCLDPDNERRTGLSLDRLFAALADVDAEIVAALTEEQRGTLRAAVPDNVRLVGFTPLHALLPTCSAVIHHGGVGTLFTALHYGVPQLVLPQLVPPRFVYDEPLLAANLAGSGAGLTVEGPVISAQEVRTGVNRLLDDGDLRRGAARMGDRMGAMPAPGAVVRHIERLVEKHRGSGAPEGQPVPTSGT